MSWIKGVFVVLGVSFSFHDATAQGYVPFGSPGGYYMPQAVFPPAPVLLAPGPFVQTTSYYSPTPAGTIYRQRVNPGLFGRMNYRTKGVDPCVGPFREHVRVGWSGYRYHGRIW